MNQNLLIRKGTYLGELIFSKKENPPKRVEFLTDLSLEQDMSCNLVLSDGRYFTLQTQNNQNGTLSLFWEASVLEEGLFAYCLEVNTDSKRWNSGMGICLITE